MRADRVRASAATLQLGAAPTRGRSPFRFFSSASVWNARAPADAPLSPRSAELVKALVSRAQASAFINTTAWSVPIYTVPHDQPTVEVSIDKANVSRNPLQAAWDRVPLPSEAQPARGTDKQLVVWQPSTDKMFEFWAFEHTASGPVAQWGGAMSGVSKSPGFYDRDAWRGAQSSWGASGSSLPLVGGLITLEDLEMGQINHALAIAIPYPRAGVYAEPAQRTDGSSGEPDSLPEGAHLRLDPSLKLGPLRLPRLTLMIAEAAQRYGIIVRDTGANVAFYAQDPTPTGANPYAGADGYFEGKSPQRLLASFPWRELQVLRMRLRSIHPRHSRR
jgi:hypothetical protein